MIDWIDWIEFNTASTTPFMYWVMLYENALEDYGDQTQIELELNLAYI